MSLQTINIGTTENDGTGDQLRTAFQKINENSAKTATIHRMLFSDSLPEGFKPDFLHVKSGLLEMTSNNDVISFDLPWYYFPKFIILRLSNIVTSFGSPEFFINDNSLFIYDDNISDPSTFYGIFSYIPSFSNRVNNSFVFSISGNVNNTYEFIVSFEKSIFASI